MPFRQQVRFRSHGAIDEIVRRGSVRRFDNLQTRIFPDAQTPHVKGATAVSGGDGTQRDAFVTPDV
jgi:hypothetical protein